MNRGRAALLSLAIAASAIAGLTAVRNSVSLGGEARRTSDAQIARQSAQLDRYQASLVSALAKRPPALPKLPVSASGGSHPSPVRVVYQRAPSTVVSGGREHEDGEHEDGEHEGGGEDD